MQFSVSFWKHAQNFLELSILPSIEITVLTHCTCEWHDEGQINVTGHGPLFVFQMGNLKFHKEGWLFCFLSEKAGTMHYHANKRYLERDGCYLYLYPVEYK